MDKQDGVKHGAERLIECTNCGNEFPVKETVEIFDGQPHCYNCARDIQKQIEQGGTD